MKNSPGMNTGKMPSVNQNRNVNSQNKSSRNVDYKNLMVQGESKSRMNRMDLGKVTVPSMKGSDQDCDYN